MSKTRAIKTAPGGDSYVYDSASNTTSEVLSSDEEQMLADGRLKLDDIICDEPGDVRYEIQSRDLTKPYATEWDASAVGRDGNEFNTIEEAEAMIEDLKKQSDDSWREGEYRVVQINA